MRENFYQKIVNELKELLANNNPLIIAIEGRSASGKSSLAERLAKDFAAEIIHIDDFFLRPEQRRPERLAAVGEFFDKERLLQEVLLPLSRGEKVAYRRYDCQRKILSPYIEVNKKPLYIVEGVYSLHPQLRKFYQMKIFLSIDKDEQIARLRRRCPEKLESYIQDWLPREEAYFAKYNFPKESSILQ